MFIRRVTVRIRFSVLLVNGFAHVFVLLSVVIVTLPNTAQQKPNTAYATTAQMYDYS